MDSKTKTANLHFRTYMARKEQSECQIFNKGKPLWAKKGKWRTLPGFRGKLLRVLANAKVRGIPD